MRNKLSWKTLDKLNSSQDIYKALLKKGIKGCRGNESGCPLAVATGYTVSRSSARRGPEIRRLTDAEGDFVDRFDQGEYPELDKNFEWQT